MPDCSKQYAFCKLPWIQTSIPVGNENMLLFLCTDKLMYKLVTVRTFVCNLNRKEASKIMTTDPIQMKFLK